MIEDAETAKKEIPTTDLNTLNTKINYLLDKTSDLETVVQAKTTALFGGDSANRGASENVDGAIPMMIYKVDELSCIISNLEQLFEKY